MKGKVIGYVFLFVTVSSCAPTRFAKPLNKGQKAVSASLGGPLIGFSGLVIPVPFTTVCAGYGVNEKTTAFASVHTTSLAFGVFQTDFGVIREVSGQNGWKPGISVTPAINFAFNKDAKKLWPELDVNAYWNYRKKNNFIYAGISNWFELSAKKAHDETQPQHWFPNFQAGHTWVRNKMNYSFEWKYLGAGISNEDIVVDYKGIGRKGAVGIYFSVIKKF